ncbi:MAG: hypothetical protein H6739_03885 [Alphaproteobacteria bacterium]|nr:hypothetical protein [Alphaproteobacteria bacterium]
MSEAVEALLEAPPRPGRIRALARCAALVDPPLAEAIRAAAQDATALDDRVEAGRLLDLPRLLHAARQQAAPDTPTGADALLSRYEAGGEPDDLLAALRIARTWAPPLEGTAARVTARLASLGALDLPHAGMTEVVLATADPRHPEVAAMRAVYHQRWRPRCTLVTLTPQLTPRLSAFPAVNHRPIPDDGVRAYVCTDGACGVPIRAASRLSAALNGPS